MLVAVGFAIRITHARSQPALWYEPVFPLCETDREHLRKAVKHAVWGDFFFQSCGKITHGRVSTVPMDLAFAWQSEVIYYSNYAPDFVLLAGAVTWKPPRIQKLWFSKRGGKWVKYEPPMG
jgi:hypothetical protein